MGYFLLLDRQTRLPAMIISFEIVNRIFTSKCGKTLSPQPIFLDGIWSDWGNYNCCSSCADETPNGHNISYRTCDDPAPKDNGLNCTGDDFLIQSCTCIPGMSLDLIFLEYDFLSEYLSGL